MSYKKDYLIHYGIKGMKWGVRKDKNSYKSQGIRAALARRSNAKVDKSFKKWNKNAQRKANAIDLGKKANESKLAYEKNKKDKAAKRQYKADNKAYKKALRKNTTYRKGAVKGEVGKDLSRKYLSEAKKAKNAGDQKTYSKMMSKHDIERAKARNAPKAAANRSKAKANVKRKITVGLKSAGAAASIAVGAAMVNKYTGGNMSTKAFASTVNVLKRGKNFARKYVWGSV